MVVAVNFLLLLFLSAEQRILFVKGVMLLILNIKQPPQKVGVRGKDNEVLVRQPSVGAEIKTGL